MDNIDYISEQKILLLIPFFLLILGISCSSEQSEKQETVSQNIPQPTGKTLVYDCLVEWDLVVKADTNDAWLFLPDTTIHLPRVRSASGARYATEDYLYWTKDTEAIIEVGNQSYGTCDLDKEEAVWQDARLRGATFRASGNEPGWYLEMFPDSTTIILDYGQDTLKIPTPKPHAQTAQADTLYKMDAADHSGSIAVKREPCTLPSGKEFSLITFLTVDEKEYRGCGRMFK
ncbi:MAG: MliC family protein [Balneolaceae bacterium]|nr:MliC family protein [Balneolaceae bacterium]